MRYIRYIMLVMAFIGISVPCYAEELSVQEEPYWRWFFTDTARTVSAPARWDGREWAGALSVLAVTGGLYAYDPEIQDWVRGEWTKEGDRVTDYIEPFGNGKYLAPALGAYYLYGSMAKEERAMRTGMLGFEAYVVSGITVNILKYATHRHRPMTDDPHNTWDGPSFVSDNLSFPSGHASSAFSVAAVLASEYRDNAVVKVTSYGIATLVALSRIYDDKHWASDAFLGSAIGYATGKAIHEWRSVKAGGGVVFYPMPFHDGGALMVSFEF